MKYILLSLIAILPLFSFAKQEVKAPFYEFNLTTLEGKKYPFSQLKNKPVLIVNTASECGFTPQLKDLEILQQKYSKKGLVILAVPSNDFKQEKATAEEILSVAQKDYKTTFQFLEKQTITGKDKSPLYQFLLSKNPSPLFPEIRWNFEKFLVDKSGAVVDRWSSLTKPTSDEIQKKIEAALK